MATARPVVTVYGEDGAVSKSVSLPHVFAAPLRADLVRTVHTNMAKNKRQAHGVKDQAGYDTAAASWGTGRAVSRIPRVPGGGTHRSGQGAFGNMCRGGGMFNPLKTWRRWHRKTNTTMKRHALACAVAASGVPALVMARGHQIMDVPELPLVVADAVEKCDKTKAAAATLKALGCQADLDKVKESKKVRCGRGKARNRRYVMRKGPLVVYAEDNGVVKAFRNIPGVELANVERLNLLQLAPGGTFGRFVVYTEGAVAKLAELYGSDKPGSSAKKGYTLPRALLQNADISRIINSSEIQDVVVPAKTAKVLKTSRQRKNPLKNTSVLGRMCPWAATQKRLAAKKQAAKKVVKKVKGGKAWYKALQEAHAPKVVEEVADEAADEE